MEKYYLVQIVYEEEEIDKKGNAKMRTVREKYLTLANDIGDAEHKSKETIKKGIEHFEITQIREFPIIGIIK